jgi:hypothetical protein
MSDRRLPAKLEVSGLVRRIESDGGFATILNKGDADGGAMLLIVSSRGRHVAALERILGMGSEYEWRHTGPTDSAGSADLQSFLAKRTQFDPDLWVVEVDIADPERFIAETTALG